MPFWIEVLVSVFLIIGSLFALIGAIGLYRLPDFYTRLHGPTKATTLGVGGIVIASMLFFSSRNGGLSLHELLITLFSLPHGSRQRAHAGQGCHAAETACRGADPRQTLGLMPQLTARRGAVSRRSDDDAARRRLLLVFLLQLLDDRLLQAQAELRVESGWLSASVTKNTSSTRSPSVAIFAFCTDRSKSRNSCPTRASKPGTVGRDDLENGLRALRVVVNGDLRWEGEVLELARYTALDDGQVVVRIAQRGDQSAADFLDALRVVADGAAVGFHDVGVQGELAARGEDAGVMDVQVELIHRRHGYRKEIVLVRRIDEDLRAAFELALRGFLDQDQRAAIGRVLDDRIGVPGDIGGGVAQEIVVTQLRPELLGIIRIGAMAHQIVEGGALCSANLLLTAQRIPARA